MKVDIQSIHFTADYRLLDFITKKMEKVQTFYDGIKSTDVYLRVEKDSEKENKTVEGPLRWHVRQKRVLRCWPRA